MSDLVEMRKAAREGKLDKPTRARVLADLRAEKGPLYDLVDIAGWMGTHNGPTPEELQSVESFLEYKQDTMIPGLALTILATRWGLAERYASWIHRFLAGVPWDLEGTAKLAAATAAGKLLKQKFDSDVASLLLQVLRNPAEPTGTREAAYSSLAISKGISLRDQINARRKTPAVSDLEARRLGEDGPHRDRIRQEENFLRQVDKALE